MKVPDDWKMQNVSSNVVRSECAGKLFELKGLAGLRRKRVDPKTVAIHFLLKVLR